ncbi:MAG: hypothetical protein IPG96_13520 [Proteobacteria bacterium]|nr:hypothetical protein [Pseudomonadota bacterium]
MPSKAEEQVEVRHAAEEPQDHVTAGANDLRRQLNDDVDERAEVHAQQLLLLAKVTDAPARRDRQQQGGPGLERPGQRRCDHIDPVGVERVQAGMQGAGAVLELLDQVLLVAALVELKTTSAGVSSGSLVM